MDRFSIADVAHLLGLSELKNNSSNPETYCVCPFCGNQKGKFSYIVKKGNKENMYHCWSCGESGTAVELYMKLSGKNYDIKEDYKQAVRDIFNDLGSSNYIPQIIVPKDENKGAEKASDEHISLVYTNMLKLLSLSDEHKADLIRRGLDEDNIRKFKFKSMPSDSKSSKALCHNLRKMGLRLDGVPGFYLDNGTWNLKYSGSGYLCPVYDGERNLIIGFQIRVDKPIGGAKYLWLSSSGKEKGCSPGAVTTFLPGKNHNIIIIVEGILKAIIVYCLLGKQISVMGVPGVNAIKGIDSYLKQHSLCYVFEAYDMDKSIKTDDPKLLEKTKRVADAALILRKAVKEYGFGIHSLKWDFDSEGFWKENYKGLDDFLLEYQDKERFISYVESKGNKSLALQKYLNS